MHRTGSVLLNVEEALRKRSRRYNVPGDPLDLVARFSINDDRGPVLMKRQEAAVFIYVI